MLELDIRIIVSLHLRQYALKLKPLLLVRLSISLFELTAMSL